jgi:serine/threonine protein kinase/Flp pilus assembly protein TadD
MAADNSEQLVLLNRLADEFAERYRRGERPSLQEYIDRHPELADDIREFFPAMAEMEQVKDDRREVSEPAATGPLPALERLGDFRILREIGHGGMGVVYEAEQVSLGRRVALKVLPQKLLVDARTRQRFEREAKAAAKLHHTNIVPVFGVGQHDGLPYYVMQFIQGLGLDEVLEELKHLRSGEEGSGSAPRRTAGELRVARREVSAADVARSLLTGAFVPATGAVEGAAVAVSDRTVDRAPSPVPLSPAGERGEKAAGQALPAQTPVAGRLSDSFTLSSSSVVLPGGARQAGQKSASYWQSVARIGVQVADALEYAHKQGIQHRDIKPSNLLLDTRGTVWVTDFGLAKADDQQNLTHTGDVVGTLRYMPPEAFEGRSDARGDVYALGLTLYELLCLRPAFAEKERNRLIRQVMTGEPARLDRVNPEVPRDLVTIVHKATQRDPAHRYATAGELAADLQRFLDDEAIEARRQTQAERFLRWARRHPGIAVLAGVLTAVLVLATVASLLAAGHFNQLRWNEAQAAQSERDARDREAKERKQAVKARKAADESRAQAVKALQKAEESYARARAAVNDYLTAVSDDPRLKEPGLSLLRAQLLQSALGFYQEFLKERADDPALRRELATVYLKVGQIYSDLGQPQPAVQSYAQARHLYEALAGEAGDDPAIQDGLARALFRLGQNDRAIALWEKLVRPDDPRYHADLGWAYTSAAVVAKDPAKELEFLRKALAVREQLVKLRPDDPDARQGLAASLNNIAVALGSAHPAEQIVLCRRAAGESEVAYKLRPNDPLILRGVIILTWNVASMAKALGHADEAIVACRRGVEVLDRWARANPDGPGTSPQAGPTYKTLAAEMITGYQMLAAYLRELGRLDEAARVSRQGFDWAAEVTADADSFFLALALLHLEARAVAEAQAKTSADARSDGEREASAAVVALRHCVLTGLRDLSWLKTNPTSAPLGERAECQELIARVEALTKAEQVAKNTQSPAAEKVTARQECLAALEAVAGPDQSARWVRRSLAQARQDLAQALLGANRVEDARLALQEARAVRQRLLEESPSNEQLRADLAQSQSAAGDLFAAVGKLTDAAGVWEEALATLEDGLKKSPNSIPFQAALSERLLHVADQYGRVGLWDRATKHYRRAFEVQPPTDFAKLFDFGVLLAAAGDSKGLESLADRAAANLAVEKDYTQLLHLSRILLLAPELAPRHPKALGQIIEKSKKAERNWGSWCQGLAHVRLGQAERGAALLEKVKEPIQQLPALAIALHQLGRTEAARDALRQADEAAEHLLRDGLVADTLQLPGPSWSDWLLFHILRREAHQAIHGKPMPESPYDTLFRGRVLGALDKPEEAEAEFAAAAALRPMDADVWLTRGRIYARLGRKDRMAADLLQAQQLKGDDPRPWVETGRLLAEQGEHERADVAFTRAAVLGKGELDRFLESGWWVVGPYPEPLDLPCPPEAGPDPSKPVAAVGRADNLKWQAVSTTPVYGDINFGHDVVGAPNASFYALAYVYADRDRTASLWLSAGSDKRLWVNGQLVFAGFGANRQGGGEAWVPVSLRAGRNQLLLKTPGGDNAGFRCLFHDAPERRAAVRLYDLRLWDEAAEEYAEADRRGPPNQFRTVLRVRSLLAVGRTDEARRAFAQTQLTHEQTWNEHMSWACPLPPEKSPDRDLWVTLHQKMVEKNTKDVWGHFWLGNACYRAGRFDEAEKSIRQALALADRVCYYPLLASTLHRLGRADEARKVLQTAEERSAKLVKEALAANSYRTSLDPFEEMMLRSTLPEARVLIRGANSELTADEVALRARARQRLAELEKADDFVRLTETNPDEPRLWVDLGRHFSRLGRGGEAAKAVARAVELSPQDPQVWKERGRAYADLGKWDEAAADLSRALELTVEPKPDFPNYPWRDGRGQADEMIAGSSELFKRVAKARPKDSTLSARRVEHFARAGRWPEAQAALRNHVGQFPDDWWAPCLLAKLLLLKADVEEYREICRKALDRFAKGTDYNLPINIARTALLAPAAFQDSPLVGKLLADADGQTRPEFWMQATAALAEYRRGNAAAAVKRLDSRVTPLPNFPNTQSMAEAVRALACQKAGRTADARAALSRAKAGLARHRPSPDRGWVYDWDWHNWVQVEILVREAESLIPAAPATAAVSAASGAQEENARRERKARADRLSTEFALALIRVNVGPKAQAEAELRAVLAGRVKIAEEEPTNLDYRADLLASRIQVGRFLANSGRIDEADKELTEAVVTGQNLVAERPGDRRARLGLAAAYLARGQWYGRRGLWRKAADDYTKAYQLQPERFTGLRLGILLARIGEADRYRDHCKQLVDRYAGTTDNFDADAALKICCLLGPKPVGDPARLARLAEVAVSGADSQPYYNYFCMARGLYQYRTGQFDAAVTTCRANRARMKTTGAPDDLTVAVIAVEAMALHRCGDAAAARRLLAEAPRLTDEKLLVLSGGDAGEAWHDVLAAQLLYREAQTLIEGKKDGPKK